MNGKQIDDKSFRKYGRVIGYSNKEAKGTRRNLWRIIHRSSAKTGWRVAVLVLRDKSIGRLEMHPDSDETLEPIKGRAWVFVAREKDFSSIECFLLDKPVLVFKGIWHGLIALDAEAEIKISENETVACHMWPFGFRVSNPEELQRRIHLLS